MAAQTSRSWCSKSWSCGNVILLLRSLKFPLTLRKSLANREVGKSSYTSCCESMNIEKWLAKEDRIPKTHPAPRNAETFAVLGEMNASSNVGSCGARQSMRKSKSLRHLPFSKEVHQLICKKFQVHQSIARAVSRSDVPLFSCERLDMEGDVFSKPYPSLIARFQI